MSFNEAVAAFLSAAGGAIDNAGTANIDHSVVFGNSATGENARGGGIRNTSEGQMILSDTIVSSNTATAAGGVSGTRGGGIDVESNAFFAMTDGALRGNTVRAPGGVTSGGGLNSFSNLTSALNHHGRHQQNGVINVPYFQRGSRNPVVVTATKVNQAQSPGWSFNARDLAANTKLCT